VAADRRPLVIDVPLWVEAAVTPGQHCPDDEAKMALVIQLARENVERRTGGPFGAAVFERDSGRLVAAGVNSVTRLQSSALHAEMLALMLAQHRVGSFTLRAPHLPPHELVTSCEPCAMCLGATLWSGVQRVVMGAAREDAMAVGFDEGPVFPESYAYLAERGLLFVRDIRRAEASRLFDVYRHGGGVIYNADPVPPGPGEA
jgi:tRNA(Arg) A34 adenosine deaminase TadA